MCLDCSWALVRKLEWSICSAMPKVCQRRKKRERRTNAVRMLVVGLFGKVIVQRPIASDSEAIEMALSSVKMRNPARDFSSGMLGLCHDPARNGGSA